jgi:hypothetical protein
MIKILAVALVLGCVSEPLAESWKADTFKSPEGWILITPEVPKPKTFIEQHWPHWEKPLPSNRVPFEAPFRMEPLQVV